MDRTFWVWAEMTLCFFTYESNSYYNLTLSETGSGTYIVKQGGANLPRMTFGFENYQNCPQM